VDEILLAIPPRGKLSERQRAGLRRALSFGLSEAGSHERIARSRFRRGGTGNSPSPRIKPRRNSGKREACHFVATIMSQAGRFRAAYGKRRRGRRLSVRRGRHQSRWRDRGILGRSGARRVALFGRAIRPVKLSQIGPAEKDAFLREEMSTRAMSALERFHVETNSPRSRHYRADFVCRFAVERSSRCHRAIPNAAFAEKLFMLSTFRRNGANFRRSGTDGVAPQLDMG